MDSSVVAACDGVSCTSGASPGADTEKSAASAAALGLGCAAVAALVV